MGSNQIPWTDYGYANAAKFAYELGKMFSYLHYVLNMDGYDCELLLGQSSGELQSSNRHAYLIDFDKVSCLKYKIDGSEIVHRKLDETTYDKKEMKTLKKYGLFLFTAMISMSLVPSLSSNTQPSFIQGYREFVPKDPENIKYEIARHVVEFIQEYE